MKALRYLRDSAVFWWQWTLNRPIVWVSVNDGSEETEQWSRRDRLGLRPNYYGLLKECPCGCKRRLGRIVLYSMDCREHGLAGLAAWADEVDLMPPGIVPVDNMAVEDWPDDENPENQQ